jgi:hypothetical protein
MRNPIAAAAGEPVAAFGHGALFVFRLWFIIEGRPTQSGGYRIDDGFQLPMPVRRSAQPFV